MHTLVPSDRVERAAVYGRDGAKLGTIERLMLEKVTGTVAYVVIKTGGLLGTLGSGASGSTGLTPAKTSATSARK